MPRDPSLDDLFSGDRQHAPIGTYANWSLWCITACYLLVYYFGRTGGG